MDSYEQTAGQCCGGRGSRTGCPCNGGGQPDLAPGGAYPFGQTWDDYSMAYYASAYGGQRRNPAYQESMPDWNSPAPGCPATSAGLLEQNYPVAMAYVPWQQWQTTYPPEQGLTRGTIFPDLDLKFVYGRCCR